MNEILDLLPIPAERDLPVGKSEARRDALVAAIRVDAANESLAHRVIRKAGKTWLTLLGIVALGVALLTLGLSAQQRPVPSDAALVLAAAGTAQIAIAVAPRMGLADSFSAAADRRFARPHRSEVRAH